MLKCIYNARKTRHTYFSKYMKLAECVNLGLVSNRMSLTYKAYEYLLLPLPLLSPRLVVRRRRR